MQVLKINNNASFKGLWSVGERQEKGFIKTMGSRIYLGEATYHPFADETKAEIKEAMDNAKKYMAYSGEPIDDPPFSGHIYITKPLLGEKLSITKAQYHEIADMQTAPHPISDNSTYYTPTYQSFPEVKKIIDEIS